MQKTSKYWDMISQDDSVILFNTLYEDCLSTNNLIVRAYDNINRLCNKGFSNLLSGRRVLLKLDGSNNYDSFLGFGNAGFGVTNSSYGNLYYSPRTLKDYKKLVLKNCRMFKLHVKKSSQYRDMYAITIKALTKIPDVNPVESHFSLDIDKHSYMDKKSYVGIRAISPFERYRTGFDIELIGSTKDASYYNCSLRSGDVSQDVELYHVYDDSSKLLKIHLDKLKILENKFNKYVKSVAYKKLNDELDVLEVTKTI